MNLSAPERGTIFERLEKSRFFCAILIRVMTAEFRTNLLKNKARLVGWINEIDRVIHEIALNGTASATISAGGGSKSYTRLDLSTLRKLRTDYADQVSQISRRLQGVTPGGIRHIMTVRF